MVVCALLCLAYYRNIRLDKDWRLVEYLHVNNLVYVDVNVVAMVIIVASCLIQLIDRCEVFV